MVEGKVTDSSGSALVCMCTDSCTFVIQACTYQFHSTVHHTVFQELGENQLPVLNSLALAT